jgi:predicted nucleic acid-binding protein
MIVDTSALLAYFDSREPDHAAVAAVIDAATEPLVVSPYVVAELDYLILTRHGSTAEQAVLEELASGAWELATMPRDALATAAEIVRRYADVTIGVADASNIVLAQQHNTRRIATLDHRHFTVLRFADGSAPEILPA